MESKTEETFELTIFDAIGKEDLTEFKKLLAEHKGDVNFFDENGMTALQHAAYKGNKDMVQLLLDRVCETFNYVFYTALFLGRFIISMPLHKISMYFPCIALSNTCL